MKTRDAFTLLGSMGLAVAVGCAGKEPEFDRNSLPELTATERSSMNEFESDGFSREIAEACVRLGVAIERGARAVDTFASRYRFFHRYCEKGRRPSGWESCYEGKESLVVENVPTDACKEASLSMLFCLSDVENDDLSTCDSFRPPESCDPGFPRDFIPMPEDFACDFRSDTYQFVGDDVKSVIGVTCVGLSGEAFEVECDPPNGACTSSCRCSKNAELMRTLSVLDVHGDEFLELPLRSCEALAR